MKPLTIILISLVTVVAITGIIVRVIYIGSDTKKQATIVSTPEPAMPKKPVGISIIVAIPVEPWVSRAAELFAKEDHFVKGRKITVEVIPMNGLSAQTKWANGTFNPVPTAWLAESRAWVDQANIACLKRTGQDIFLAGGRYRAQPVILSPLVWGIWRDAYNTLVDYMGTKKISWDELHKAAVVSHWKDLGGEPDSGEFKLVVAHPRRDPAGLTAMVSAAGEYFDKPDVFHPKRSFWSPYS